MKQSEKIRVGIVGATGYTGLELSRLLAAHPGVTIHFVTSRAEAGRSLRDLHPTAPPLPLLSSDNPPFHEVDVVFLCLPHAAAARTAGAALEAGARVIDLSADFRLRDPAVYEEWYNGAHPLPHLLPEAVYGLTEWRRQALPQARLVANPGCYPTSILLALWPLLVSDVEIAGPLIADAKSGVSGAGRTPSLTTHFVEVANNLSPYKVGRVHRHLPEMEQTLAQWRRPTPELVFTPHLLPVPRGMLSTVYVPLSGPVDEGRVRQLYEVAYRDEPFVEVLPQGKLSSLAHACWTNRCVMSLTFAGSTLIVVSAIDNLIKGAAGQAIQNMNVVFGLDEALGLPR